MKNKKVRASKPKTKATRAKKRPKTAMKKPYKREDLDSLDRLNRLVSNPRDESGECFVED